MEKNKKNKKILLKYLKSKVSFGQTSEQVSSTFGVAVSVPFHVFFFQAFGLWGQIGFGVKFHYMTHTHRYCIGCSHPLISCFLCFLSSLQWTSQAWTWASRNIILTSTTKSTATCWISKFNTLTDRLSFWVSIKLCFFFIGQTSASSHSLSPLPRQLLEWQSCMFIPCGEKASTTFTTKSKKKNNNFWNVFVYSFSFKGTLIISFFSTWNQLRKMYWRAKRIYCVIPCVLVWSDCHLL